jgi:hypothetical protein
MNIKNSKITTRQMYFRKKLLRIILSKVPGNCMDTNNNSATVSIDTIIVKKLGGGFSPSRTFFNHYLSEAFFSPFTPYKKCAY